MEHYYNVCTGGKGEGVTGLLIAPVAKIAFVEGIFKSKLPDELAGCVGASVVDDNDFIGN
jgi:hypothetical protein